MKSSSFRTFTHAIAALGFALLVASCGGGGAGSSASVGGSNSGGSLQILPASATWYAGVTQHLTIAGGRPPYTLTSSEPAVLPVPPIVNGHDVDLVPANPGVIDVGLPPDALPIRTVTITVRDSTATFQNATIQVARNFLTGYGVNLVPITCTAGTTTTTTVTPTAAAGCDTLVRFSAILNGNLYGDQAFRVSVVTGNFLLREYNVPPTGVAQQTVTVVSDHQGNVQVIASVPPQATTQTGIIRITHVPTGVYFDQVFTITGINTTTGLTAIPAALTFTGALSTQCGTGSSDVLIFDGLPPYSATSTSPNIVVTPVSPDTNPGRFRITANNSAVCGTFPVVFTDANGRRVTVVVTTALGTIDPTPPPDLAVSPVTLTLGCSSSGSVQAVGGSGGYTVTSTHPRVTAVASGHVITITRLGLNTGSPDPAAPYPTTATVTVSDGTSLKDVTVTVPATCVTQ